MTRYLNLYSGVGGNRHLLEDVEVTAVDISADVMEIYAHNHPNDTCIVGDAHQYLLDNYDKDWDFIWSSPPCPSHSRLQIATRHDVRRYPDMSLYQQIIWLQHFAEKNGTKWVVENVKPYYKPLIPAQQCGRHLIWSSDLVSVNHIAQPPNFINLDNAAEIEGLQQWLGIQWNGPNVYLGNNHSPGQAWRNAVHPTLGRDIFNCVMQPSQGKIL